MPKLSNHPASLPTDISVASTEPSKAARHNSRQYVMQALYQWQLTNTALATIEEQFLARYVTKNLDQEYFHQLLHAIPNVHQELDREIIPLVHRPGREINPIELAITRLATYELLYRPDIPYRVIINEALQLTKKFGAQEGYKFVNGILDRIAKKTRALEINLESR